MRRGQPSPPRHGSPPPPGRRRSLSPPPPPPPMLDHGSGDVEYVERLAQKIQKQAVELLDLRTELEERRDYIVLCEKFVIALDPSQPLPLLPDCLDNLKIREDEKKQGLAKVNSTSRHTLTTLTRQYDSACKRLNEQGEKIKEVEKDAAEQRKAREIAERRIASLQHKLEEAQNRITNLRKGMPSTIGEDEDLKREMEDLERQRKQLLQTVENEARTNEEQRIYIDVLQNALKARAEELGLDPAQILNTEKAKYDVLAAKASITRLQDSDKALKSKVEALQEKLRLETLKGQQLKSRLRWYEPEEVKDEQQLSGIDAIKHRNVTLKQENDALVDYVRETLEPLKAEKVELEESLDATARALERAKREEREAKQETESLQNKLKLVEMRLLEKDVEINAAKEARETSLQEKSSKERELEELQKVRDNLLTGQEKSAEKIRELEQTIVDLKIQYEQSTHLQEMLNDTQNALRCERKEIVTVEEQRLELSMKVKELEEKNRSLSNSLSSASEKKDMLLAEKEELVNQVNELKGTMLKCDETIDSLRAELRDANGRLTSLDRFKESINGVEDNVANLLNQSSIIGSGVSEMLQSLTVVSSGKRSILATLESTLPSLGSLLFAFKTRLEQASRMEESLKNEVEQGEKRFEVEKRLLHDEIHSLRNKFEELERYSDRIRKSKDKEDCDEEASLEMIKLRKRYALLESKYAALEEKLNHRTNETSTIQNVRSKIEQANNNSEQVAYLKQELEKAAKIIKEHEALSKRVEDRLVETEDQLHHIQYDVDLSKRLCTATIKGIAVRYRNSHPAVQRFFVDRQPTISPDDSMEQTITPLCELMESILEQDTKAGEKELDKLTQTLEEFRREQMGFLNTVNQKQLSSSAKRSARIQQLNDSLIRAQHVVEEARQKLESELQKDEQEILEATTFSDDPFYHHRHHHRVNQVDDDDDNEEESNYYRRSRQHKVRARSPAKVKVYRDGSIQVSTFKDEVDPLQQASHRLDQIDRIRRFGSSTTSSQRPDTPLARRYRQQFRAAQEKFRRLNHL